VHKSAYIVNVLTGKMTSEVQTYRGNESAYWEAGSAKEDKFWHAVTRQSVVNGYLRKEIESYGTLRVTEKGHAFLKSPHEIMLIQERDFSDVDDKDTVVSNNRQNGAGALDQDLLAMLRDLRKKVAKEKSVPPYVVFQDPSLEEIATHYPISIDELTMISGVGRGKAMKFGQPFIAMIKKHVEENDIDRAQDMTVKTIVNKSGAKVNIIQNIDRKLPLEDIAKALGKELGELIEEIETIVASGTKINIDYYLDELLDEDSQGDIFEYFMEAESDSLEEAIKEFDGDYTEDELRLMRIKFMSEVAN
ncbi:MAG: HRDC domain-containing protein, partial [Flavobacteriales bacterium]|nr:HRDC domain-containing protein [Flavobacteriales bacterium]